MKLYTVTYEVLGGKRTDTMEVWAASVKDAIKQFEEVRFDVGGIEYTYSHYSILSISE